MSVCYGCGDRKVGCQIGCHRRASELDTLERERKKREREAMLDCFHRDSVSRTMRRLRLVTV